MIIKLKAPPKDHDGKWASDLRVNTDLLVAYRPHEFYSRTNFKPIGIGAALFVLGQRDGIYTASTVEEIDEALRGHAPKETMPPARRALERLRALSYDEACERLLEVTEWLRPRLHQADPIGVIACEAMLDLEHHPKTAASRALQRFEVKMSGANLG